MFNIKINLDRRSPGIKELWSGNDVGVNFGTFGLGIDLSVISQMYNCFQLSKPAQLRIGQIHVYFTNVQIRFFFRNEAFNWILLFFTLVLLSAIESPDYTCTMNYELPCMYHEYNRVLYYRKMDTRKMRL